LSPAFARGAPAFTRRFFEGFFPRCPRPFTLVLDDYDALPPPAPLHEVFAELVAAIPPGCRLIVIGREEPPPSLARFRGSGVLAVLGGLELTLTAAPSSASSCRRKGAWRRQSRRSERAARLPSPIDDRLAAA